MKEIRLEGKILNQINTAVGKAIIEELVGYNKPLSRIVTDVIESHEDELFAIIDKELVAMIDSESFKAELKNALNSKIAKVLIGRLGGELEKKVNELKANPATRAKITLYINGLIESL